jgi:hypothetical protein
MFKKFAERILVKSEANGVRRSSGGFQYFPWTPKPAVSVSIINCPALFSTTHEHPRRSLSPYLDYDIQATKRWNLQQSGEDDSLKRFCRFHPP